jgi:ABC-type Na+ efflux pump permease subunit
MPRALPVAVLVRSVVLEARRGGLPWLAVAAVIAGLGLAAFVSQVALTESRALQAALLAAVWRAAVVFLVATQVTASTLREIQDKGLELMLSLPLSRTTQYLARLAGFAACGVALAIVFAVPMLAWAPPGAVLLWGVSLACEAALVAAAALFFAMTLQQFVPAITATAGLYLLGRSIGAIQAMAATPIGEPSVASRLAQHSVDALALVLPRLDAVTRTAWLLYEPPAAGVYAAAIGSLMLYVLLLAAGGLFDFHRRNL